MIPKIFKSCIFSSFVLTSSLYAEGDGIQCAINIDSSSTPAIYDGWFFNSISNGQWVLINNNTNGLNSHQFATLPFEVHNFSSDSAGEWAIIALSAGSYTSSKAVTTEINNTQDLFDYTSNGNDDMLPTQSYPDLSSVDLENHDDGTWMCGFYFDVSGYGKAWVYFKGHKGVSGDIDDNGCYTSPEFDEYYTITSCSRTNQNHDGNYWQTVTNNTNSSGVQDSNLEEGDLYSYEIKISTKS